MADGCCDGIVVAIDGICDGEDKAAALARSKMRKEHGNDTATARCGGCAVCRCGSHSLSDTDVVTCGDVRRERDLKTREIRVDGS